MDAREAWNDGEVEPVGDYVIVEYKEEILGGGTASTQGRVKVHAAARGVDLLPGDVVVVSGAIYRVAAGLAAVALSDVLARVSQEIQGEDRILMGGNTRPGFVIPIPASEGAIADAGRVELVLPCAFRGEQIVLDPVTASYFDFQCITVGQRNQAGFGRIPCSVFMPKSDHAIELFEGGSRAVLDCDSPPSNAPRVRFSLGQSGEKITFGLKCKSERPRRFGGGVLVGTAVW